MHILHFRIWIICLQCFCNTIHCLKGPVQIVNPSYRDSPFSHVVSGLLFNEFWFTFRKYFDRYHGPMPLSRRYNNFGTVELLLLWEALGCKQPPFSLLTVHFWWLFCVPIQVQGNSAVYWGQIIPQGASPPRLYENRCLPILFIFEGLWICMPPTPPLLFWAMSIIWGNSLEVFPKSVCILNMCNKAS